MQASMRNSSDPAGSLRPVAVDPASERLLALAERVAASGAGVMLTGESGTGKEVYARFVHQASDRAGGPFVALNCAAIPETMLEAILFGYERGAFTGALSACPGKFEQADGGTLLLDEVTEMDLGLQAKLLRVLQEQEVERLGGRRSVRFDVRVIATSNRELAVAVRAGVLREDLYYRLNVFPLHVPPLRERRGDVLPLAQHLLARHAPGRQPGLTAAAAAQLRAHDWPGNVRELENVMQRALVLSGGGVIESGAIQFDACPAGARPASPGTAARPEATSRAEAGHAGLGATVRSHEERMILDTLHAARGSRKQAAERLGISPRTLRYKLARMRDFGLAIPRASGCGN
ncbi:sigma-54-dependent Fis family transcriptional regulator [Thioalkalivibrio sp. XN279]|uniref:sigma-54 interaction domain-containing protein n=1 Tax=Thioalkalivibrio sp. XN279 TaxID=2714953 RepID=UPI0014095890|nr:sigma-54 dependent transcriptional regulator [Thioalkalivibrio sp. XN279]NHA13370.1 sigma-54-dependent Fis family transcriptional regulator [Thioalkalivibrio sp. XN279]